MSPLIIWINEVVFCRLATVFKKNALLLLMLLAQ